MLGLLHSGLLAADQSQRVQSSNTDTLQAAIARGRNYRAGGRYSEAIREYNRALAFAQKSNDVDSSAYCLLLLSTAQLLSFQYAEALTSAQRANNLAVAVNDYSLAGRASGTLATLYSQLGDFGLAEDHGIKSIQWLQRSQQDSLSRKSLALALQNQAFSYFRQGRIKDGENYSNQSLELARQSSNLALEALVCDDRGSAMLLENDLAAASQFLNRAYSIRQSLHDEDGLAVSKEHLAELEIRQPQPNYPVALKLVNEAFASSSLLFKSSAQYYPIHIRAEILEKTGDKVRALAEYRRAVDAADQWRQGALPGDTTNNQTVALLHDVYQDFAQTAAEISLNTNNKALAREALEVLARNRAASLREQLTLVFIRNSRLPDAYFKELAELQSAQSRVTLVANNRDDIRQLDHIRKDLSAIETESGLEAGKNYHSNEKVLRKNSLRSIQSRLGDSQLLLSFSLGKEKSFLWTVTREQVNLYPIECEPKIELKAATFTNAVHDGGGAKSSGFALSRALLGQLTASELSKADWLVVGDGPLSSAVPFAGLPDPATTCCTPLIARHTLRLLPSELLLIASATKPPAPSFVGIGDPIYNPADSRLRQTHFPADAKTTSPAVSLARLPGSDREVHTAASLSGLASQQILTGSKASINDLQKSLAIPPELVHFAVHVVSPPQRAEEAALALSLKNGVPELLTSEAIATFRVPGSLIVLSGCSSGQGKFLPSAGILGLSRAWLLAGAAAVIVSSWPTPDDSGRFFSSFYTHLRAAKSGSLAQKAAFALEQTQLDMQRNGGYTSEPAFWAAYSIISKE